MQPNIKEEDSDDEMPLAISRRPENVRLIKRSRQTLEAQDRISDLPDTILLQILSLIPLKHVIQTSTVAKKWVNLWHSLPSLAFCFNRNSNEWKDQGEFISFVDRALIQHKPNNNNNTLQRFSVIFYGETVPLKPKVDSWVQFALNRNVKVLELIFHNVGNSQNHDTRYDLPTFLWRNEFLTRLKFGHCRLWSYSKVGTCKSLRTLSFTLCLINSSSLTKVLMGCPALEHLELHYCFVHNDLQVLHERLKVLVVDSVSRGPQNDGLIEIYAPCLKSLSITELLMFTKWRTRNLSSLEVAYIDFKCPYHVKGSMVKNVLASLCNVKKLTFGTWCLQVLSRLVATPMTLIFSICKTLVLNTCVKSSDLPGLACLLERCPELENLTINMTSPSSFDSLGNGHGVTLINNGASFWRSQPRYGYFICMLQHLKTVSIIGLNPNHKKVELAIEFLQYILANARLLKILSVDTKLCDKTMWSGDFHESSLLELTQLLLAFPRSSPQAVIQLN